MIISDALTSKDVKPHPNATLPEARKGKCKNVTKILHVIFKYKASTLNAQSICAMLYKVSTERGSQMLF